MISRRNIFLGLLGLAAPAAAKAKGSSVTITNLSRDIEIFEMSLADKHFMYFADMRRVEQVAKYSRHVIQKAFKDSVESGKFSSPMLVGSHGPELIDGPSKDAT